MKTCNRCFGIKPNSSFYDNRSCCSKCKNNTTKYTYQTSFDNVPILSYTQVQSLVYPMLVHTFGTISQYIDWLYKKDNLEIDINLLILSLKDYIGSQLVSFDKDEKVNTDGKRCNVCSHRLPLNQFYKGHAECKQCKKDKLAISRNPNVYYNKIILVRENRNYPKELFRLGKLEHELVFESLRLCMDKIKDTLMRMRIEDTISNHNLDIIVLYYTEHLMDYCNEIFLK